MSAKTDEIVEQDEPEGREPEGREPEGREPDEGLAALGAYTRG
jgi:hypothetical protein